VRGTKVGTGLSHRTVAVFKTARFCDAGSAGARVSVAASRGHSPGTGGTPIVQQQGGLLLVNDVVTTGPGLHRMSAMPTTARRQSAPSILAPNCPSARCWTVRSGHVGAKRST
jgi:hypothetical protein